MDPLDIAVLEDLFPLRDDFIDKEVVFIPGRVYLRDKSENGVIIDIVDKGSPYWRMTPWRARMWVQLASVLIRATLCQKSEIFSLPLIKGAYSPARNRFGEGMGGIL